MTYQDPPKLTNPASLAPRLVQDALTAAQAATPTAAQLAKLGARLPLAAALPVASAATGPSAAASGSLVGSAVVGAMLGALVSGAMLLREPEPRAPEVLLGVATPVDAISLASRAASRAEPMGPPAAPATVSVQGPGTAARPTTASPSATTSSEERTPEPTLADDGVSVPAPGMSAMSATGAVGGMGAVGAVAEESEVRLLQRAQDALSGAPDRALGLTREHAARFPAGVLTQEREVVAIQALLRLGRRDEARARAEGFVRAFPGSAHRRRVEALAER